MPHESDVLSIDLSAFDGSCFPVLLRESLPSNACEAARTIAIEARRELASFSVCSVVLYDVAELVASVDALLEASS